MNLLGIIDGRFIETTLSDLKIFNGDELVYSRDMINFEIDAERVVLTLQGEPIYSVNLIESKIVNKRFRDRTIKLHLTKYFEGRNEIKIIDYSKFSEDSFESFVKRIAEHLALRFESEFLNNGLMRLTTAHRRVRLNKHLNL